MSASPTQSARRSPEYTGTADSDELMSPLTLSGADSASVASWRRPGALVCLVNVGCHRTEDLVQFGGQVFDLLLERDGGDLFVLVVLRSRLVSRLVEIHGLMLFRCARRRSGLCSCSDLTSQSWRPKSICSEKSILIEKGLFRGCTVQNRIV